MTFIVCLALAACSVESPSRSARSAPIIGGSGVGGAFDAVGLIADLSGKTPAFLCTGTLIADSAVLTAAHCLAGRNAKDVGFVLAKDFATVSKASIVAATGLEIASLYQADAPGDLGSAHDIGVMLFAKPFAGVSPMPLIRPSETKLAYKAKVVLTLVGAGYSSFSPTPAGSGVLRRGEMSIAALNDFELDVALPKEPQPCFGDSGGPLLWEDAKGVSRIAGIISRNANAFTTSCSDGAIATRVDAEVSFISTHVTLPCGSGVDKVCPDGGVAPQGDGGAAKADAGGNGSGVGGVGGSGVMVPREDDGCALTGTRATSSSPLSLYLLIVALGWALRRRP